MKLWSKNDDSQPAVSATAVNQFTVGNDREFDLLLAPFDVLGNIAHATMLGTVGLLTKAEVDLLVKELRDIYTHTLEKTFSIRDGIEDIHSEVEFLLTRKLGDIGKKIHSARSRNDQVLIDIKLFLRSELEKTVHSVHSLFDLLIAQSEKFKVHLLPGYTHLQLAMPSSFGLWFGAYAESLVDDLITVKAAYDVVNKNPLGSAAGYGSSFPINRVLTTELLGFADLHYNVVYAQMGRGKTERIVSASLANIADTLSRLSMDACLFLNTNFGFIQFPTDLTTGSSIMPHKKNPDVFELVRGHCNRIRSLPNEIMMMTTNLPSGYHRDMQLLKEQLFPAFETLRNCINMLSLMLSNITVKENILEDEKYRFIFSVEEVNRLVLQGMPFRDAYRKVALEIESGNYNPQTTINHTHEGSIGNLCNDNITANMQSIVQSFHFDTWHNAIENLVKA